MSARLKLKKANDRIKGAMLAAQNAEWALGELERNVKSRLVTMSVRFEVSPFEFEMGGKDYLNYVIHNVADKLSKEYTKYLKEYLSRVIDENVISFPPDNIIRIELKGIKADKDSVRVEVEKRKKWI